MGQRNSHIINHTLRIYLIASILAVIVVQLNSTIDSIVVGQYIAADSISVVALAMPIVNLLMIPSVMIMMGSSILMAPALGNQDYRRSDSLVMMIVEGFCRSIDYRYRNGVNSLYLNFSY